MAIERGLYVRALPPKLKVSDLIYVCLIEYIGLQEGIEWITDILK